jgi:membrane protein YqaA with SNARE-associated domain
MPGLLLLFAIGATFNPFLVGVISAAGGAIGEMTGYVLGYTGHTFIKRNRIYIKTQNWMKRWGAAAIFVIALIPFLPMDVAGLVAGVSRFPVWKFLLAALGGKAVLYTIMALAGAWGWDIVYRWVS